jgi:cobaltochelatase CobN
MNEVMLEAIRKEYWNASEATRREIAEAYAQSVARHGEGGGLRGGGNVKLEAFVKQVLEAAPNGANASLVAAYEAKARESVETATESATSAPNKGAGESSEPTQAAAVTPPAAEEKIASADSADIKRVRGRTLKESTPSATVDLNTSSTAFQQWRGWMVSAFCATLVAGGYFWRRQRRTW